ncbi:MAG: hypothetical protein LBQ79_14505 [Deltaproteobacteria bacterium]|jgi:hypothetical protein|nr:hypothetical protein [Deltaproteobacteria bacterium]
MTICDALLASAMALLAAAGQAAAPAGAPAGDSPFDRPEFWLANPDEARARDAWENGARWSAGRGAHAVFRGGEIYGFAEARIPGDEDGGMQARLDRVYASRTGTRAVRAAGLFAFSSLECPALAGYAGMQADLPLCSNMTVKSSFAVAWDGRAAGIARILAEDVCSCRKALGRDSGGDNSGTFFGQIARQEVARLAEEGLAAEIPLFFEAHRDKKVFLVPELIVVVEAMLQTGRPEDAAALLDEVAGGFGDGLDSEQWEKLGDLWYRAGLKDRAVEAYNEAGRRLH